MKDFKTNLPIKIAYTLVMVMPLLASARPGLSRYEEMKSSQSYQNSDGGQGSGGGSFVLVAGRKQLLDIYVNNGYVGAKSYALPRTRALNTLGVEKINGVQSEVLAETQARIDRWASSSPQFIQLLKQALNSAPFYYINLKFNILDRNYDLENKSTPEVVETGALTIKNFGVAISLPSFEELDSESQVALLIHESIRYVNIIYGFKTSPRALQRLTVLIAQGAPSAAAINSPDILEGGLYNLVANTGAADAMKAVREFCELKRAATRFVNEENATTLAAHELCEQMKNSSSLEITSTMASAMARTISAYADLVEPQDTYTQKELGGDSKTAIKKKIDASAMAQAMRLNAIALNMAGLTIDTPKYYQTTATLKDSAVNLGILNVVLDNGITSSNQGGKTEDVKNAKAVVDSLIQVGLFK